MHVEYTEEFHKNFQSLTPIIQKKASKALRLLAANPRHPSLRVKKIRGGAGEMEGRFDRKYRFLFTWIPQGVLLLACGPYKLVE